MDISSIKKTMRIGMMGPFYPVPDGVAGNDRIEYMIKKSHELGCKVLQLSFELPEDDEEKLKYFAALGKELDVEFEVRMPFDIWQLTENYESAKKSFEARIKTMKILGCKIMRGGYGKLKIESSRFNKDISIPDHLKKLEDNLKLAAKIVEENDVYLAIENHCDFKGVELATVFKAVGSKNVGCAMDTANGFTVFCDPNDDVEALAPYTITTHVKDMVIKQETAPGDLIPFFASGCALGDGHVNIPRALDLFAEKAPYPENLHIIIETGWHDQAPDASKEEKEAFSFDVFHRSIAFLKKHLYE